MSKSDEEKEEVNSQKQRKKKQKKNNNNNNKKEVGKGEGGFNVFDIPDHLSFSEHLPITNCPISKVTVLNNMAEITRTLLWKGGKGEVKEGKEGKGELKEGKGELKEGKGEFVLTSLPPSLDPSSLRVSSLDNSSIILEVPFPTSFIIITSSSFANLSHLIYV